MHVVLVLDIQPRRAGVCEVNDDVVTVQDRTLYQQIMIID